MTQYDLIIKYLKKKNSITPMDAFRDLGITKLATRISEMRKMGYQFSDEWIEGVNNFGVEVRYKRYHLITENQNEKNKLPPKDSFLKRLFKSK